LKKLMHTVYSGSKGVVVEYMTETVEDFLAEICAVNLFMLDA